jgi:hypothetical protein
VCWGRGAESWSDNNLLLAVWLKQNKELKESRAVGDGGVVGMEFCLFFGASNDVVLGGGW